MHNFENRFYNSSGIGRNLQETAEVDTQATLFTKVDSLFMYTNYTTTQYLLAYTYFICVYCNMTGHHRKFSFM